MFKIQNSCDKVISNIEKMAKRANDILKRIEADEEKYNKNENGYFFSVDNKDIIKNHIFEKSKKKKLKKFENNNNDEKLKNNNKENNNFIPDKSKINEILLPKLNFIMNGLSFDQF